MSISDLDRDSINAIRFLAVDAVQKANSGHPGLDYAIFTDQIPATANNPQTKVFFLSINDTQDIQLLQETFPAGVLWQYDSDVETKDFMIFFVPPSQGAIPDVVE